jgi:hypothetical protein
LSGPSAADEASVQIELPQQCQQDVGALERRAGATKGCVFRRQCRAGRCRVAKVAHDPGERRSGAFGRRYLADVESTGDVAEEQRLNEVVSIEQGKFGPGDFRYFIGQKRKLLV